MSCFTNQKARMLRRTSAGFAVQQALPRDTELLSLLFPSVFNLHLYFFFCLLSLVSPSLFLLSGTLMLCVSFYLVKHWTSLTCLIHRELSK